MEKRSMTSQLRTVFCPPLQPMLNLDTTAALIPSTHPACDHYRSLNLDIAICENPTSVRTVNWKTDLFSPCVCVSRPH